METIRDLEPGQRLLVRIDVNAPVDDAGRIKDHARFERHAATIDELKSASHSVILLAHQGRPGRDTFCSLEQHAEILAGHLDSPVEFVPSVYDEDACTAIEELEDGEVLLLENVRFADEELADLSPAEYAETDLVRTLANAVDAYVNDGYSVAHRDHASIVGFPELLPAYAGPVMEAEYENNTALQRRSFDGPVTMVLGGKKASDVIGTMEHLEEKVDRFLLGGVVGELFLRAEGYPLGYDVDTDLYDGYYADNEELIEDALAEFGDRIELPTDLAYANESGERTEHAVAAIDEKTVDYLDIGHETIESYVATVERSAAVLVKGALGVFEDERFKDGTVDLLEAIGASDCYSVVGGGDTSRAVRLYALEPERYDHLSIAGGAYISALTGASLPGIDALEQAAERMETASH